MSRDYLHIINNFHREFPEKFKEIYDILYLVQNHYRFKYSSYRCSVKNCLEIFLILPDEELQIFYWMSSISPGFRPKGPWVEEVEGIFDEWEEAVKKKKLQKATEHANLVERAKAYVSEKR